MIAAIKWYSSDFKETEIPEYDEIVSIQEKSDECVLAKFEVLGYLRIRDKATYGEIMAEFDEDQCKKLLGITEASKRVTVRYPQQTEDADPIVREFLASTDRIRRLRFGASHQHGLFVMPEDVLDEQKVSEKFLALWPKINTNSLHQLLSNFDNSEKNRFKPADITIEPKARGSLIRRWKYFGIVDGDNKAGYKITNRGKNIAYAAARDRIAGSVNASGQVIALTELEEKNQYIPTSLILRYLEEQEVDGAVKKSHSELFWFKPVTAATDQKNQQQVTDNLEGYVNFVKDLMYQTPNDRARKSVHDIIIQKFQCSHFTGNLICDLAEKKGIEVIDNPVERSWRLPLDERILRSFRKNHVAVTVEEMHAGLVMPSTGPGHYEGKLKETKLIREELESLCQKNLVKESGDRWSLIST